MKNSAPIILSVFISLGFVYLLSSYSEYLKENALMNELSSVVTVYRGERNCSGYVLAGTHTVVTDAHCVEELAKVGDPVDVQFSNSEFKVPFYIAKIGDPKYENDPDLMLLYTKEDIVWPEGLPICDFKPYYGELLHIVGAPLDKSKTMAWGRVSRPERDLSDQLGKYAKLIQWDGTLILGESGGPAIDDYYKCVQGVGALATVYDSEGHSFALNYLIPAIQVQKFIDERR